MKLLRQPFDVYRSITWLHGGKKCHVYLTDTEMDACSLEVTNHDYAVR